MNEEYASVFGHQYGAPRRWVQLVAKLDGLAGAELEAAVTRRSCRASISSVTRSHLPG